jgi:hypothetical protein
MADAVDTITSNSGSKRVIRRFYNVSDGTGESNVIKIDKSLFTNSNGVEPTKLIIEWVQWSIQGFTSVKINFDHTTDDEAIVLAPGNGYRDYTFGGGLTDPASAGQTGDLLFTTAGAVSGASYDILMSVAFSN